MDTQAIISDIEQLPKNGNKSCSQHDDKFDKYLSVSNQKRLW